MNNRLLMHSLGVYYQFLSAYDVYATIIPARDNEYFISAYNNKLDAIIPPRHVFSEELPLIFNNLNGKILTTGNIEPAVIPGLSGVFKDIAANSEIDKKAWVRYTFDRYNCNDFVNLSTAEPFYLKQVYTHKQKNINQL